jgi:hypothetical protein
VRFHPSGLPAYYTGVPYPSISELIDDFEYDDEQSFPTGVPYPNLESESIVDFEYDDDQSFRTGMPNATNRVTGRIKMISFNNETVFWGQLLL